MDTTTPASYREIVRKLITDYSMYKPSHGEIDVEVVFDDKEGHYHLIHTGWSGSYRIHGSVLHLDIRDGKVWIQHDGTEDGVAEELVKAGIPRDHIVLAFKHPSMRKHTGFAVA